MNFSTYSPTGPELEELYLKDKTNDHLKQPDNLKLLLTHILNKDMKELTSSDFEILDYCQRELHPEEIPVERKMQFLEEKYSLIADEKKKQRCFRKMAAMAASFLILLVGGVLCLGSVESEAGIFDWVRSIFVEEKGEQMVIGTPDATMQKIEYKDGHLPEKLPGFTFDYKSHDRRSVCTNYLYTFNSITNKTLIIEINEYPDYQTLFINSFEIIENSTKKNTFNNTTYYYSKNIESNCITWIIDTSLYSIWGEYDYSELEKFVSYYTYN